MRRIDQQLQDYPDDQLPLVDQMLAMDSFHKARTGWEYRSYEDLVLALGEVRTAPLALPDDVEPMRIKQCYSNALQLAESNPRYTYVEGYAMTEFLAVQHAWVVDETGRIIDPTWANFDDVEQAIYAGVKFDTDFVLQRAQEVGEYGALASDWKLGCRALRLGFVTDGDVVIADGEE